MALSFSPFTNKAWRFSSPKTGIVAFEATCGWWSKERIDGISWGPMPSPTPSFTASGSYFFLSSFLPRAKVASWRSTKVWQSTELRGLQYTTKVRQAMAVAVRWSAEGVSWYAKRARAPSREFYVRWYLYLPVLRLVAARRETVASTRVSDVSLECFGLVW